MEFKERPTSSTPEITAEIAGKVYDLIKQYGDADTAFKSQSDSAIDPEHFKTTDKEADRLFKEMNRYTSGDVLLEPEQYHFDEETGEKIIDSKAVYYTLTTERNFKAQFSSNLLDVAEVYTDWKGNRTWTQIKNGE